MRYAKSALVGLFLCVAAACATAADFAPSQLKAFPRDVLQLEAGGVSTPVQVWIADTPEQQQQGLMFLTDLPAGYGMLFPLGALRFMTMWMKNTYVSLDMVFIGEGGRVTRIAADTTPLSEEIISSGTPVVAVLELRAGEARRLGIKVGSLIRHTLIP
ncbi:MAG: hypothetical protein RLZZ200_1587 [Pseudomonadota bacterium]|jgi:uncharacterized membrane protein (UPF0127 family)